MAEFERFRRLNSALLTPAMVVCGAVIASSCTHFSGPGEFHSGATLQPRTAPAETAADAEANGAVLASERRVPSFDWPLDEARVSRGFKAARKAHWGIDLANLRGTSIVASEAGRVIYVGRGFHGYGKLIVIEHTGWSEDWATLYAHLDQFLVKEGVVVRQGQVIGRMGRTGHASGFHLHFEIRENRVPVNPLAFLPQGF